MLESEKFIAAHRADPTAFTRRRIFTFAIVVSCIAQGFLKGLQSELDDFFGRLAGNAEFVRRASKSAFSQARYKLRHTVFLALNDLLVTKWKSSVAAPRWHGLRLLAGDASTLRLPNFPDIVEEFGTHRGRWGSRVPLAVIFGLYDVASSLVIRAAIEPAATRERAMLAGVLDHVRSDDLLLLDRGFPAHWLCAWLIQNGLNFCMRVDSLRISQFVRFAHDTGLRDEIITVKVPGPAKRKAARAGYELLSSEFRVRLIRVDLPGNKQEILATTLLDKRSFPAAEFAALYNQRWRIEEWFKFLKCRLAVEHFSGDYPEAIRQDFHAKVLASNITSSLAYFANQRANELSRKPVVVNLTYALSATRAVLPQLLAKKRALVRNVERLIQLMAAVVEKIRPGRHFDRPRQAVKPTRHRAYKATR
ncbi:MAG: IS4 family transposase [Rhodocyclaceae bacterium]|nr:IS4 family transposase [Rhodocyclaceae bacterium]